MDEAASPSPSSYGGIVAIGNLKGGVGKSTIAVGIAGAMARAGRGGQKVATPHREAVDAGRPEREHGQRLDRRGQEGGADPDLSTGTRARPPATKGEGAAMLGGLMKKLFGGGGGSETEGEKPIGDAVEHKGCSIQPIAMHKGGQFLTAGIIAKDFPDGRREHRFVRADTHSSADQAHDFAIVKGRQIIDEQGDRLFKAGP